MKSKSPERLKIERFIVAGGIKRVGNKYYNTKTGNELMLRVRGNTISPVLRFMGKYFFVKEVNSLLGIASIDIKYKIDKPKQQNKTFKIIEGVWEFGISRKYIFTNNIDRRQRAKV
jgi:hypothetical protein